MPFGVGLVGRTGLKFAPNFIGNMILHYREKLFRDGDQGESTSDDDLMGDLWYLQMFEVIKDFMSCATKYHTVEELQETSRMGTHLTPSKIIVPMSCCNEAAKYLIDVLGGKTATDKIVGGTKWWQIREINGVDGEWIVDHEGWKKAQERAASDATGSDSTGATPKPIPAPGIDEQKCILFLHGGGYYFGSVDQERYSIQRFARKINGSVLAINYRLSPQYPFPCAIQDALAAYLYLIRPPPEAHKAVKPQNIVIMGDSAGGGLSLAILQVIRDSGLPQCAGGVLISPWCDLNHSFDSIHENTKKDIIPDFGLSMHKPSLVWPLPKPEGTERIREGTRALFKCNDELRGSDELRDNDKDVLKVREFLRSRGLTLHQRPEPVAVHHVADAGRQMDLGAPTSAPRVVDTWDQTIVLKDENLTVESQIQFYAPNNLLSHPLISPCRAHLGGLPPLFFIAGDHEVLRDEIVYTAQRAANSSSFTIPDESKRLYPKITEFAAKYPTPTKVHLQVYDGCAHIFPIIFPFITPAKYCFRATAIFCRFVTGMSTQDDKWAEKGKGSEGDVYAGGNPSIYEEGFEGKNFITEKVSIQGLISHCSKLEKTLLQEDRIGTPCGPSLRRYLIGKEERDRAFSDTIKDVEQERERLLGLAHEDKDKSIARLTSYLTKTTRSDPHKENLERADPVFWNWDCLLDECENPPPSSIVFRRDTLEARKLAKIPRLTPNGKWNSRTPSLKTPTREEKTKPLEEQENPKPEVDATTKATPRKSADGTTIEPAEGRLWRTVFNRSRSNPE